MSIEAGMETREVQPVVEKRGGLHYGLVVMFMSLFTVTGALGLARFGYTLLLPGMKDGLGLNYTQTGLLATWNLVGYLVAAAVGGVIAARYGPRAVISVSMLLVGVGMLLTGLAPDFLMALIMRALTGIGSAGANVPVMALLSAWFATRRRGMAAGVAVGGSGVALVLSGPLLPPFIAAYGWRAGWYVLGILGIVIAVAGYLLLRNRPAEKGLRPFGEGEGRSLVGATVALSAQPSQMTAAPPHAALNWGLVYRSPVLWHLAVVYAMFGFAYIIYATFFATYLTQEGGWTSAAAGNLWALMGLFSIFSGFIWGTISDSIGRKYGLALVFALQGLSILIFALVRTPAGYYASAILFGLTAWSIPGIMAAACGDYVGSRLAPAALGLITVVFGIGQAIGPGLAGAIADSTGSFALAFVVAAVAEGVGAAGAFLLKRPALNLSI